MSDPQPDLQPDPQPGLRLADPAGRRLLATTVLGSGMVFLDGTITNVALPRMGAELHTDIAGLQWVVNGYALALAALILVGGSLGDRFGRRRVFGIGIAAFAVASVTVALAPTIGLLVAARVVQGVAAALLTPGSLALIQASFAPEDRMRAIGMWTGMLGIATAAGPVVGGWLVDLDWRYGFWLNVPLAALVLLLLRGAPESLDPDADPRLDVPALVLTPLALGCLTWALTAHGASAVAAGAAGLLAAVGLVVAERRSAHPMVPPALFRSRDFSVINVVTLLAYAAFPGAGFMLGLFLQVSGGWSPLAAGASGVPTALVMLVLAGPLGGLATRFGPRRPMAAGLVLVALAYGWLALTPARPSFWLHVLAPMLLQGLGLSFLVSPLTGTVLAAAPAGHTGLASGINNAVSRTGGLLAVAALPGLVGIIGHDYADPQAVAGSLAPAMAWCAALVLLGAALTWFGLHERHERHDEPGAGSVAG